MSDDSVARCRREVARLGQLFAGAPDDFYADRAVELAWDGLGRARSGTATRSTTRLRRRNFRSPSPSDIASKYPNIDKDLAQKSTSTVGLSTIVDSKSSKVRFLVCLSISTQPPGVPGRERAGFDPVRRVLARHGGQHVVGQHGVGSTLAQRW